jgi:MinD superfamily P-loop ATPase
MLLRCDVCRRYVRLKLAGLHDIDYRTKTFSCSQCGAEAYFCPVEPIKETGMED